MPMYNNDTLVDYSALVGQTFAYNDASEGNIVDNGDGTYTVTPGAGDHPGAFFRVESWANDVDHDGDPSTANVDTLTLAEVDASGDPTPGGYNGTVIVLGHNDSQIVTTLPQWDAYVTVLSDTDVVGTPITFSPNSTAEPLGTSVVCFAEGTRIATADGDVAVETLKVGDAVVTASGEARQIKWIGSMTARPARHPHPWEVNPVCVKAGAFAEGVPAREIRLSPAHAVYIDGVLIPVGHLVNGATIVQEEVATIRYFHVELDSHDVLVAEGLPCESYLDDGNRSTFANADGVTELNGRLDPKSWDDACAPMVAAGPQLEDVQRRLIARAEVLGWTKVDEPSLHLIVDGAVIEPMRISGERAWFMVPACTELTVASGAAVLAQVMPGVTDQRRLGVALSEVRVDGEALDLSDDRAFRDGFHNLETDSAVSWRWTNGEAKLALELAETAVVEVRLHMTAPAWKRSAAALKLARVA